MTDFTDIIKAQDRADEVLNANKAMINDGVESPNIPESAAQSVLLTEHPAQYEKTWEDMGRGEQIVKSLKFGFNNMKMAKAASEFMDANEASKIGLSAFADDIDGTDEESQKAVEALLAKDTAVNRQYKEEQADRAMASAYEYADLLRESTKFRAPADLAKMQEAAKGKGFWAGLFDAGKVFFDGDVIGNSIYLAGTSFGAMAPYIVMATVGNKAAALTGMSAVGGAIAGAFMGVGSYQNEYGSYIADALKEKGYDLSDPESWRKALSDQATIDDLTYRASNRAMGVSVFDAVAGHASALHFRPATALRSLRKAEKNAPSFGVRVADNAGNMTTQMAIQGALGGAGEAVGSLAAGDEVDPSAVFMEMVGELTGAPSEVLTIGVSSVNEYREDIQRVQEAKSVAKIAEQFTAAAEAVGMSLKNEEAIDAWAERVGDDKNMIAFGQDVVEQVNMQELEEVDPQLAEQVKEASEAKRSVEISVARITKIATKNRNLANALIRESKVRVDGMSPREAEEFEKTGKAEAEAQFDKILARSKGTRQQLAEAREVAADLSRQLQEAGTTQEVADLQVKPWEMMLANAARMLGTSPKDMAKRMNIRVERDDNGKANLSFNQAKPLNELTPQEFEQLEQMRKENARVAKEIKEYYEKRSKGEPVSGEISLGQASKTLQMFGIDGELVLRDEVISKGKRHPGVLEKLDPEYGKHSRESYLITNLYAAIQNPIAVFQSAENKRRQSKRSVYKAVLITELEVVGKNGTTKVIAPVEISKQGKVLSVYGLDAPSRRITDWINDGLMMGYERQDGAKYIDAVYGDVVQQSSGQGQKPWRDVLSLATGVDHNPPTLAGPSLKPIVYDSVYSVKHFGYFTPDAELINKAKENFGVTSDAKEAFYILPDGTMLDGSGRHWGASEKEAKGRRTVDHADVSEVVDADSQQAIYDFMGKTGAMRFDATSGIASISQTPTKEQLSVLSKALNGKFLALSRNTPEGRIVDDIELEHASEKSIKDFFDNSDTLYMNGVAGAFAQGRRGSYTPFNTSTNTYGQAGVITLMQESDKSTFLHESSHVWLDFHTRLAMDIADKFDRGEQLTAGEQEFLRTLGGFFKWGQQEGKISLGVDDTPESVMRAVRSWANLSIDEQRGMHELFADGFERYLIDGNSPSPEVASIFKRFASWLKKVYATATRMPNPISPEVKKLYDLLFISEQEAADAEVRAGMVAMFAADDAKVAMTDEERKQYADLNEEATLDAQGYVRKAVSGVMRVYTRLRQKEAERIYREHKERIDIRTEELMEEPRFIALDILTVGLKQKEGERIRMKLNADVLRMEGYSQETINALAAKGFVYDGRDHHDFISPKALAAQAGATDAVQLVKDLVNKKRAKAHSPLARAREMLTWGGSATKLNVRELTALGIDNDTIAELLVNDYAVDPALVAQTGSAQQLAELCGHGNAVGLIGELLEIEPARMEATKEVHAQILQETGEKPEVYTQLQADLAAHNATRSRLLHAEHNAIARMLGKKQLMVKAAREYALQKIQSMRFAEVAPYIFVRDEKRCARLAEQAYIKGDFEACLEYKRAQILNMEMARAALELQNSYEKAVRHARAAVKSKTIHKPYQKLATLLIAKHDLAGTRGADIQGLENELGELLSEMAEGGTPVEGVVDVNPETGKAIPGALLLDAKRVKDMTVEEAQNLFDALRELVSVGRNIQKQNLLETKARVREVVSEGRELLAETAKVQGREPKVEEVPKGFWEKKLDWAKGFFVDHIKIATWCRIFDQNKENGFFWNLFIRSANECASFESTERARVATELDKILTPVFGKKGAFDQDKIQIGKRLMSKGERFAVACNLGNDSNRERLVAGQPEQWTDETIEALCSSLSETEWRAVQSVWSLFESYRPLIAAKQKRVYGEEPKWIESKPLTVTTADGKTITLHGGYYPVKYDPRSDLQVQVRDDASVAAAELRGAFQSSTTNRSFTKQRTAKPNGKRLRLDMQAMFEGLDDVIHDLAWHEWLIDTRRVLVGVNGIGSGLQTTIKDLYGSHVARAFDSWRQDIAQGDRVPPGLWSGISGNVGVVAMGWNPMSALVQLTGVGYIVPRCGARNTLWALKKFMTNPRQARKTINAASKMMANRALTMNKNVAQVKGKLEAGRTNWVKENAYCMIIAVQGIVDTINWMAAYAKAMQDESVLNSESPDETAVAVADQIVIDTQGSGSTNDLAKVERDPRFDMFTVFYSWANAALNNSVALAKGETNRAKAMRDLLFMAVFMPTLEKIFRESLKAGDEEDEEDKVEELVMLPLKATVEYHLGMFVFARELSGAASSAVAGEPVYTYGGTAGTQGISAAVNLIGSASDPTSKRFLNASLDVTGAMLGLPTGQIKKTIKGIQAVESGQAEGIDAIKAPIFGYSGRVY